jgi:two-component system cell cycle response regulator DivK
MPGEAILIIDDNPANQKLARITLSLEGFVVRTAEDAMEATALLEQFMPDLILMDIQLPDMDGLELTRRFKASSTTAHIPIVAMTAYAMKGDEQRILAAGCDGYIPKPINVGQLPTLVRGHLRARTGTVVQRAAAASSQIAARTWDLKQKL